MKIHIFFEFKDGPWGGANQFLKNLKDQWEKSGIYEKDPAVADAIVFNSYQNLRGMLKLRIRHPKKIFLHRLGPIFYLHRGNFWKIIDRLVIRCANAAADLVVFQSRWSLKKAERLGFDSQKKYVVIGNAADGRIFNFRKKQSLDPKNKIRLITDCWSPNWKKGFKFYQYLDENLDFEKYQMTFVGNSPVKFKNIRQINPLSGKDLAEELKKNDLFVSAVEDDAYSNSLEEALACGLPVVALKSGGNAEVVRSGGELFQTEKEMTEKIRLVAENYFFYLDKIKTRSVSEIAGDYLKAAEGVSKPEKLGLFKKAEIIALNFLLKFILGGLEK